MGDVIVSVLTSWQVWVVTIFLILYISLVRYVGKLNRRSSSFRAPAKKPKKQKVEAAAQPAAAAAPETPQTDDLGLEESGSGGEE